MSQLFADPVFAVSATIALACFVVALLQALVVFPLWARGRCHRAGRPDPPWLTLQGIFFWPPIGALILLFLAFLALMALPSEAVRAVEAAIAGSPTVGYVILAGITAFLYLSTWLLMGRSARKHLGLRFRNVWLPAMLLMVMATATVAGCCSSLGRARMLAKRTIDLAALNGIGKAIALYQNDFGTPPDDLRRLVDKHLVHPDYLLAMFSPNRGARQIYVPEKEYTGPCDFEYLPAACDHGDLICVWLDPKYKMGEVAFVLYGNGQVAELKPDQFAAELARTRQWLKEHPAPATQPATKPSALPATLPNVERR